jgi:hypothetical protein
MVVIVAQIRNFRYFLRFDQNGEGFAEGLINNASFMTEDRANEILASLESEWSLSIEHFQTSKI